MPARPSAHCRVRQSCRAARCWSPAEGGKSTLAAMPNTERHEHIVTLEDPIEVHPTRRWSTSEVGADTQ
jgi:Tfp pilus assembly ATPase PilU